MHTKTLFHELIPRHLQKPLKRISRHLLKNPAEQAKASKLKNNPTAWKIRYQVNIDGVSVHTLQTF